MATNNVTANGQKNQNKNRAIQDPQQVNKPTFEDKANKDIDTQIQSEERVFLRIDTDRNAAIYYAVERWCAQASKINQAAKCFGLVDLTKEELNEYSIKPDKFDTDVMNEQEAKYNDKDNPYLSQYIRHEAKQKAREALPMAERVAFEKLDDDLLKYAKFDEAGNLEPDPELIEEDCKIYLAGYDLQVYRDVITIRDCAKRLFRGQAWRFGGVQKCFGALFELEVIGSTREVENFTIRNDFPFKIFRDLKEVEEMMKG